MGMVFKYRCYVGSVEYDDRDNIFHGSVQGVSDVISYEGATVDDLEEDFMDAVDSYLLGLREVGRQSKIEARTYSHADMLKALRRYRSLQRLYHKLAPKARG
jgi:predicted HicB family RNase H-like nuclease